MERLRKFSDDLNLLVIIICIACVVVMLGISFAGALYQAITSSALSWTYSLARQFVPWIALLSLTIAFKNGEHIAMTMLINSVPRPLRLLLEVFILMAVAALAIVLIWQGWLFTMDSSQLVMISDQIQFSQQWVCASVPVTGGVLLCHLVCGRELLEGPAEIDELIEGMVPEMDHIISDEKRKAR